MHGADVRALAGRPVALALTALAALMRVLSARGDGVWPRREAHGAGLVALAGDRPDAQPRADPSELVAVTDHALIDERRLSIEARIAPAAIPPRVVAAVDVRLAGARRRWLRARFVGSGRRCDCGEERPWRRGRVGGGHGGGAPEERPHPQGDERASPHSAIDRPNVCTHDDPKRGKGPTCRRRPSASMPCAGKTAAPP